MTPTETTQAILKLLRETQGGWEEELDDPSLLRGFYLCADYGTTESASVFFSLSANGAGEDLPPWAIEGFLRYALRHELFGLNEEG